MDSRVEALSNASRPVRPGIAGSRSREKTRHCATTTAAVFYVRRKFQQRDMHHCVSEERWPEVYYCHGVQFGFNNVGSLHATPTAFLFFSLAGGPNLRAWKLNPAVFHFVYYFLAL